MTTQATHSIAIVGASGRMGKTLIEAIDAAPDCRLAAAVDLASSPALGQVVGTQGDVKIGSDLRTEFAKARCLIDFTRPQGSMEHLAMCQDLGLQMVIGTTGFSPEQKEQIAQAAKSIAIVMAPNMSVGVNVTLKLLQMAAKNFALGYDVEIIEAHHKHKVDAPSGTALLMGEVIANAQGNRLQDVAVFERYGHTGERTQGSIGFATVRGGDIVGDHTVLFAGSGERIEIAHKSSSRDAYAQGSLRAVRFLAQQTTGLFDMSDVLGLKNS